MATRASAPPSWAATCSARSAGRGTATGRDGGGEEPPYHHPVFVLTHHARPPLPMKGGTTFHFVTDGTGAALEQALAAADGKDVRIGGGPATVQQYLRAGLVDDIHVAVSPILLGGGERLFDHLDGGPEGYECTAVVSSPAVAHFRLSRAEK